METPDETGVVALSATTPSLRIQVNLSASIRGIIREHPRQYR